MRWLCVCAALVACKKEPATQPAPPAGSAAAVVHAAPIDAAPPETVAHDAPAPAPLVDLLRHAPGATIRVSSRVRNKTIKPEHILDRDLKTAWNSVTGELVGAWVQIGTEEGSHIVEVRMTVGHTGKGRKGEDYFTMNPRITKVKVIRDGQPDVLVDVDPERRELQIVPIDATGSARIEVAAVKAGTRKAWREVAISELEVWGHRVGSSPALAAPAKPEIAVGEVPEITESDPCVTLAAEKEEREARRKSQSDACAELANEEERSQCLVDPVGDPACDNTAVDIDALAAPWKDASISCWINDDVYGPVNCTIRVSTHTDSIAAGEIELESAKSTAEVTGAMVNKLGELEIHYETDEYQELAGFTVVCTSKPALRCGAPIPDKK